MLRGLGARLTPLEAPFDPEPGAYQAHGTATITAASMAKARSVRREARPGSRSSPRKRGPRSLASKTSNSECRVPACAGTHGGRLRMPPNRRGLATGFRRALPADGVAVAGLSDRRVLLFERHRMGGRGRRHRRRGDAAALARGDDRARAAASATRCSSLTRTARPQQATTMRCARSPSWPRRSRRRRSATWRRPRRAAPSSTRRARPGRARRSIGSSRPGTAPSRCRSRSASPAPATASPLAPALAAYLHALAANLDLGRRAAHPARPDRRPARAGGARAGRGGDRRSARSRRRSTTSAARRSAPTSPACGTRRSTRGCSDHDSSTSRTRHASVLAKLVPAIRVLLAQAREDVAARTRPA